uniref:Uncharacterized protein n=1 Tax=Glossina austeni TaxID=7395 RepID=A0A1A9VQM9_GLOAU
MNIPHKYSRIEIDNNNNNNNNDNDNNSVHTNKHYIACDGIYYSGEIYFIVPRVVCYVTVEHGAENSDSFSNESQQSLEMESGLDFLGLLLKKRTMLERRLKCLMEEKSLGGQEYLKKQQQKKEQVLDVLAYLCTKARH